MTNTKETRKWLVPAALLYIAGFIAAQKWDLEINKALFTPSSLPAILGEVLGWIPAFVPMVLLIMLWSVHADETRQPLYRRLLGWLGLVVGYASIVPNTMLDMNKRGLLPGIISLQALLWVLFTLVLYGAAYRRLKKTGKALREKLLFAAVVGSVYLAINQVTILTLKTLWQRTRFDTMITAGSFADFTPWYQPFGNGGSSMPSGHVANAAGIFVLLILCDLFPHWNRHRKLVTILCWGFIAAVAASRIVIGRHFLSDTLAASALMAIFFYLIHHSKYYNNALAKRNAGNKAITPGGKQ